MLSLWLVVVALTSVASAACPERCSCGNGDELEYLCQLAGGNVTVTAGLRDYGNIDCEGGALTCADFPSLPVAGNLTLPSLSIRDCSLPDPLSCIASKLDATGVDSLMLKNVLTPLEQRHLAGLGSTKLMMFNAGAQTSIPSSAISSLPSLHHFRLCGGDVTLTGSDFRSSPLLTYLELATDHITALPADSFQGLGSLKVLNLWGNNVSDIHEDALRGLSSLEELYISASHVGSLPASLLAHTPTLRSISLTRNAIAVLPGELFRGLRNLRQVTISNDVPLTVEPLVFANLSITSLKLEQASISELPPDVLANCSELVNLTLARNRILRLPDQIFDGLTSLQKLDLSYNKIANVSNRLLVHLKALRELNMDENLVEELPGQLFAGLRHLESFTMSSNRLHHLHPDTFQGSSLLHLSLSHNSLSFASPLTQYYNLEQYSPFNNQFKLRTLKLSRNLISTIFADWRNVLLELTELDLKYNSFEMLMETDLQFLSSQIVVDLRHNNISTLLLAPGVDTGDTYDPKATILLDNNPFNCDCRLYEVARRLRGARPLTVEPLLDLGESHCVSPPDLHGLKFADVPLDDFICDAECPCQCQIRPFTDSLDLDCYNDTTIPDPREYGLSHTVLRLREMPTNLTFLPDHVTVLNLSGVGLKTSPGFVPKSVTLLDLSDNELDEIPVDLLVGNLTLRLSGNAFPCECESAERIALANSRSGRVADWQRLRCRDGTPLWRVEPDRLCVVRRAAVLGGLLALLGALLAAAALLAHRYALEIRVFLTNRGLACCLADEYDPCKRYDVFVSFAHEDAPFVVERLLPRLEREYSVCVHHRDWRVGDLIPAQIARSVEESRRTLVVLSRRFLASAWGMLEFRAAHAQAARDRRVRVVVLLLDEPDDADVRGELRAYLATNTYVRWDDPWVWEKLRHALPRRPRARDVRDERRARRAADKMARAGLCAELAPDGRIVNVAGKGVA